MTPSHETRFRAVNPATGEAIPPDYQSASLEDLERAARNASDAFPQLERLPGSARAQFLRKIAANIETLGSELFDRVMSETGLPAARVQAETGRTCSQLRLFAEVAEQGSWVEARIDRADPDRKPTRRPDVRSMLKPIGPVAVFGASNFPLAFSVAGGDTASALAAGNPVIVKAHSAHPGTSEIIGRAIRTAVHDCRFPEGTFSLLFDSGYQIATALVAHPEVKAVGFTGSRKGGRALMHAIATRPDPIPFYGEMSSVNPVFFLPGIFGESWKGRVEGLFASLTGASGQFCTKPGIFFVESGSGDFFATRLRDMLANHGVCTMLTLPISHAYEEGVSERQKHQSVSTLLRSEPIPSTQAQVQASLFRTDVKSFLADSSLGDEIFGPVGMLVTYSSHEELLEIARSLEGQLTATVHGTSEDLDTNQDLLSILEKKAGRLIFNGFPTGVEVGHAMVHGGPWPATSDGRSTSVGSRAIARFARPVCYQDFPQMRLPDELKDTNPLRIWRTVDGRVTQEGL